MNSFLTNWKTTLAGLAFGAAVIAAQAYQPGMTPVQWGKAILLGLLAALPGVLAKDHNV